MKSNILEKIPKKWKGVVTFENFKIDSKIAEDINNFLANAIEIPEEIFNEKISQLKGARKCVLYNKIVLSGRSVLASLLNKETTYTGAINYGAVGTGITVVADSDIKLTTEVKRKGIATRSRDGDTLSLRFFFSKSDISGTLNEFGTFIDGSSTVDTGILFNKVLTGGWAKSTSEALTVTVQLDLNPS